MLIPKKSNKCRIFCRSCPASLEASLTRAVLDEAKSTYLSGSTFAVSMPNDSNDTTDDANYASSTCNEPRRISFFRQFLTFTFCFTAYKSLSLLQSVTSTVNQVCKKLKLDEKSLKNVRSGNNRVLPCSVHAVKNGRRKMEDRHVLIHDLNAIYCDSQVRVHSTFLKLFCKSSKFFVKFCLHIEFLSFHFTSFVRNLHSRLPFYFHSSYPSSLSREIVQHKSFVYIWDTLIPCNSHEKISNFLQSEEPPLSFYGVYDGHAGKDAAAFAASHLHGRIISSPNYPTDPVAAIKDAFNKTDEAFLDKVSETSSI